MFISMRLGFLVLLSAVFSLPQVFAVDDAKIITVFVEEARITDLSDKVLYPARIDSKIKVTLYAPQDGIVINVSKHLGHAVNQNEVVIQIRNTDPLYKYVPLDVVSSVSGFISRLEVNEGARVVKNQPLMTIIDSKQLKLTIEVAAQDSSAITQNLEGMFTTTSNASISFPVQVSGISPLVDPATGTATAELNFMNLNEEALGKLSMGTLGRVTFALRRRKGIQIPEAAIVYRGKETFVRAVQENKAKFIPITLGDTREGQTEILTGLKGQENIITRASGFVGDGQVVKIQEKDQSK